jgi:ribosomal protein L12E/L44/L45/RPP1/RPP2
MWKTTGPDLETHTCRKDLFDEKNNTRHSYEQCPTQHAEKHPEELQRQAAEKQKQKEEKKKKKQEERQKEAVGVLSSFVRLIFF